MSGSHWHILSYLTEQVLSRQPEEIQQFLLQTSILDRLNGDLCNTVTGRTDGQLLLERLFNANLFLIPLDDEQQWYRYHHLFADLLRNRQNALQKDQAAAALGLFSIVVPADMWPLLVVSASAASLLIYVLYIGPWAILPMAIDAALLWRVPAQHWSVAALRGL